MPAEPIIKRRRVAPAQEPAPAAPPSHDGPASSESTKPPHSKAATTWILIGAAMALVIALGVIWLPDADEVPAANVLDTKPSTASANKPSATTGRFDGVLERTKNAVLLLSNSQQQLREAVTTRQAAQALKSDKTDLVELSRELEESAKNDLAQAQTTYAEVLWEAHRSRSQNISEFDAAASTFVAALRGRGLDTQASNLGRAVGTLQKVPANVDRAAFSRLAEGSF